MTVLMGAIVGFAVGWNMVLCGMLIFRRGPYGRFRNRRLVILFLVTTLALGVGLGVALVIQMAVMLTMPFPVASASVLAAIAGGFAVIRLRRRIARS